ncbi:FIST signal transduction protein [Geomonas oryzae]|uniref:FIST signal transduction protein n=1 Tax=Geomonas oryzae TaxID=2364273 RepID=UPI00100B16E5|nr:FIST N-terminal domain-containing protein [Geomonas oryzae]
MGTCAGVGFSSNRNPSAAGKEAARKALEQAKVTTPDFVLVFATVGYDQHQLIASIRETTGDALLCGCSGEGIITRGTCIESNFGVCVMTIASDEIRFHGAHMKEIEGRAEAAGEELAATLKPLAASDTRACLLFADGLVFNFDPFLSSFERTMGRQEPLPVFGGLAADNWALHATYQYHNDAVFTGGMVAVLMSGSADIVWGVNHGCVPVGSKRTITRCAGNVIQEIDGRPALEALQEYLDPDWMTQWNKSSLNLCLGFKTPEHMRQGYEEYVIRYMPGKNDGAGEVIIQSEVTPGTELWIMRRDKELITAGLGAISRELRPRPESVPKFVLHFECVGRGKVVFRESEKSELLSSLQGEFPDEVPWIGFYTYGEIGPIARHNCFHNFTAVVAAVY